MPKRLTPHVLSWADNLEDNVVEQATRSGDMPFVSPHVALMPDAHLGMGATIGSVIPTRGAIMPAAVGVDIGCGMIAVETTLDASDLPDDLGPLLSHIEQTVPAGVGKGHQHSNMGDAWIRANPNESVEECGLEQRTVNQFGSLGSGNHFVEICLVEALYEENLVATSGSDPGVWVVLHSGSRGVGNILARKHIETAKGDMKRRFIQLDDPDLAYFVEDTEEFTHYIEDLMWAQRYALANREAMMDAVLDAIAVAVSKEKLDSISERRRINCHHNYIALENHMGRNLWITRKGAIRARVGDWGVVPGSMGTNSFIVKGKGNKASFQSSAHGAGRRMSRKAAKRQFTADELTDLMKGKTWLKDKAALLIDEDPRSYKDINRVMALQADLVEIKVELRQILNYKGT